MVKKSIESPPLESFISERAYFSKKKMPTITTLKERLQKTPLSRLEATLRYLYANPPSSELGWYGHGMGGGPCVWRQARLGKLHDNRIAALNTVIRIKLRDKEKLMVKNEKLKERKAKKIKKAKKAKKAPVKARTKAKK